VPEHLRRLEWLTGFTGSAGMLAISGDEIVFFTDGRYTTQAKQEIPDDVEIQNIADVKPWEWCAGRSIYVDSRLHTIAEMRRYTAVGSVVISGNNLLDELWQREFPKASAVVAHPLEYAGEGSSNKKEKVLAQLREKCADAVLLTAADSISWLLNIRCSDVDYTPIVLSFALLHKDGTIDLFRDPESLEVDLESNISVYPVEQLSEKLGDFDSKRILLDPNASALFFEEALVGNELLYDADPCLLPKALKNKVEQQGAREAHIIDGVALVRFLHWVEKDGVTNGLTEWDIAQKLLEFRKEDSRFKQPSFATIAGFRENGAVIHYNPTASVSKRLSEEGVLLIDSGGQYLEGTTDVTRTILLGRATEEQKQHFTLVLKGHIALAKAVFDIGTTGSQLDHLARTPLQQEGLDYDHGTGHGVGSYMNVHEGPQRISKAVSEVALQPGMIISNEPGYYQVGSHGIRIENLVLVVEQGDALAFETLTLAPIDTRLIDADLLDEDESKWFLNYHQRVYDSLAEHLSGEEQQWLASFCA
jgi:Xaa-Pro aminopeptidase